MRSKDQILTDLWDIDKWKDEDRSRKAHQTEILIEVLIDIRDILVADMKTSLAISKAMSEKDLKGPLYEHP